jgi:hypothetical protein
MSGCSLIWDHFLPFLALVVLAAAAAAAAAAALHLYIGVQQERVGTLQHGCQINTNHDNNNQHFCGVIELLQREPEKGL